MRLLAEFAMGSRFRAVTASSALGLLGLIIPPLSLLASAVPALIALRKGGRAAMQTMGLALPVAMLLGLLLLGDGISVGSYLLLQWGPVVLLALWLRNTRSLASTLLLAAVPSLLIIVMHLLLYGNDSSHWLEALAPLKQTLEDAGLLNEAGRQDLLVFLASWMTGILAAGFLLQNAFVLLIARWWQALLYNPGGFREEFHSLHLGRGLAAAGFAVTGASLALGDQSPAVLDYLALLVMSLGLLQGLALVHGAAALRKLHPGWLIGMYVLMFVALAQTLTILAFVGLADAWFNFRSRLRPVRDTNDPTEDE